MKKDVRTQARSLSDKILGTESIRLSDETQVIRHRSDFALFFIAGAGVFLWSLVLTEVQPDLLITRSGQMFKIFGQIFRPDWSVLPQILPAIKETVLMSITGTLIGVLSALPMAALSSYNVNSNTVSVAILKALLSILRSFPIIIVATISTLLFSLGTTAGTVTIAVFTFTMVSKMLIESVETMDMKGFEAMQSFGSSRARAFVAACLPELWSTYVSYALYSFEINVRTASILGYVGAGGIGVMIAEKIAWRDYNALGAIIFSIFALVMTLNLMSGAFRSYYTEKKTEQPEDRLGVRLLFLPLFAFLCYRIAGIGSQALLHPKGWDIATGIVRGIFTPDLKLLFNFTENGVLYLMLQTIAIAFAGTVIGSILALPVGFLCSRQIMPAPVAFFFNALVLFIRTIPTLVWALIWIRVTGPGPFCGVITQGICSIGMLSRMYSNAIDDLDDGFFESMNSMGFTTFQKFRHGIMPQLRANLLSTSLYRFDINLKDATTLGIVGAGGIGAVLIQALNTGRWSMAGSFIFTFVLLILAIEALSTKIKRSKK